MDGYRQWVQTFLPYPDDRRSAAVLDDRRLGKQRVETLQVLRALTWHHYGWRNHPAVRMWRGFVPALVHYGVAACDEWVSRGRADAVRDALLDFSGGALPSPQRLHDLGQRPPWLGLEAFHASHRSALVRKDPAHYRPFFPDVPDDLPYLWPATRFPQWPLRRGHRHAVPVENALGLLDPDQLSDRSRTALQSVAAGRSVDLVLSERSSLAVAGRLAAMVAPGVTVWLVPGDEPPVPGPAPAPQRTTAAGSVVSASIARAPQPEDLDLVRAEVAAGQDPEVRFLRLSQLDGTGVLDDVGLVVTDPDVEAPPGMDRPVLRLQIGL